MLPVRKWKNLELLRSDISAVFEAELLFEIEQLVRLLLSEVVDAAQLPREQQNSAIGIKDFGLPVRLFEVFAEAHGAMILEDHAARAFEERQHRVGELLPARRLVRGDRNLDRQADRCASRLHARQ